MKELFIWHYTINKLPKGVPEYLNTSFAEVFKPKKPMQDFDFSWVKYKWFLMEFPPTDEKLKLPTTLFLVIKNCKKPEFDYLDKKPEYKVFSQKLYDLLVNHGLNTAYEKAYLTLLNTKGEPIGLQPYYLLRFARFDDDLFDFHEESKIDGEIKGCYLYPNLTLKTKTNQDIFILEKNVCYSTSLIITKPLKEAIEAICYEPEIYSIKEFPQVWNDSMNAWKKK